MTGSADDEDIERVLERAENDWYHPMAREDRTRLAAEVRRLRAQPLYTVVHQAALSAVGDPDGTLDTDITIGDVLDVLWWREKGEGSTGEHHRAEPEV